MVLWLCRLHIAEALLCCKYINSTALQQIVTALFGVTPSHDRKNCAEYMKTRFRIDCFYIKQAATGNLKARYHCVRWYFFWQKKTAKEISDNAEKCIVQPHPLLRFTVLLLQKARFAADVSPERLTDSSEKAFPHRQNAFPVLRNGLSRRTEKPFLQCWKSFYKWQWCVCYWFTTYYPNRKILRHMHPDRRPAANKRFSRSWGWINIRVRWYCTQERCIPVL